MPRFDITCMSVVNLRGRGRGRLPYENDRHAFCLTLILGAEIAEFGLTKDVLYQTVIFSLMRY